MRHTCSKLDLAHNNQHLSTEPWEGSLSPNGVRYNFRVNFRHSSFVSQDVSCSDSDPTASRPRSFVSASFCSSWGFIKIKQKHKPLETTIQQEQANMELIILCFGLIVISVAVAVAQAQAASTSTSTYSSILTAAVATSSITDANAIQETGFCAGGRTYCGIFSGSDTNPISILSTWRKLMQPSKDLRRQRRICRNKSCPLFGLDRIWMQF